MYKKHTYEERLLAVEKCLSGIAPKTVARQMGIEPNNVSIWLSCYQLEGPIGLLKCPMKHADFAEKCKIVCEYAEKGVEGFAEKFQHYSRHAKLHKYVNKHEFLFAHMEKILYLCGKFDNTSVIK